MKNSNYFFVTLLLLCFLSISSNLYAQSHIRGKGFFVDADLGFFVFPFEIFMGQASLSSGYRFNKKIALGLEARTAGFTTDGGRINGFKGGGMTFRFTHERFLAKLTQGYVFHARAIDDSPYSNDFKRGGTYNSLSLAYRMRSGFSLGATYTLSRNIKFTRNYHPDGFLGDLPSEDVRYNIPSLGIMLGWTFPRESNE